MKNLIAIHPHGKLSHNYIKVIPSGARNHLKTALSVNMNTLSLSLTRHYDMLTLFIQEAELINVSPSYVRVKLIGDDTGRLDMSTDVHTSSGQPFYNEHISWEIQENDHLKQLRLTVYQMRHRDVEAIGTISICLFDVLTSRHYKLQSRFVLVSVKRTTPAKRRRWHKEARRLKRRPYYPD